MMGSGGASKMQQKRRSFSGQFIFETVMEVLRGEESAATCLGVQK
jgi:hypothetical protein